MRDLDPTTYRASARARLAFSYAAFLFLASACVLLGIYIVLRYIPDYPLTAVDPADAASSTSRGEILGTVVLASVGLLCVLALVGPVLGWWLAGRILRPLNDLHLAALTVAGGHLDHRVRLQGPRDEFAAVADSFDLMLDRLGDAFAVQERFAANAAHELRTPLTITRTMLDVALADHAGADHQTLDRLSTTTDRAIDLTEALLGLADANHLSARRQTLDLTEVGHEAVALVGDEAAQRGIEIQTDLAPSSVTGDRDLLRQMLVNLLQNGVRHNHTGGDLLLRIEARSTGGHLEIHNAGPRLNQEQVNRFTEPHLRGAGRTAQGSRERRGHGLGLALVARIVDVHHGKLSLRPRPEGGLAVTVDLPIAPGTSDRSRDVAGRQGRNHPRDPSVPNSLPKRAKAPRWAWSCALLALTTGSIGTFILLTWDGVSL